MAMNPAILHRWRQEESLDQPFGRTPNQRPILAFVTRPHRLKPMNPMAIVSSRWSAACASAALLTAAVMNIMELPTDAAVPALLENNSIAAEMAAGRTSVTANALINIGTSNVTVVIAS